MKYFILFVFFMAASSVRADDLQSGWQSFCDKDENSEYCWYVIQECEKNSEINCHELKLDMMNGAPSGSPE